MRHQQKIPTILGLLLVLGAVFVFSVAFDRITPLLSRASPTSTPKHVTFSNVSDTSFTISWTTDAPATGAIIVDGSGIGTAYDQRDEAKAKTTDKPSLGAYHLHSVLVRNARPGTAYHIRILSDGTLFQNGVNPFTVTTGPTLPGPGNRLEPAYGTVTLPTGQPAEGAIVYLTPEGGQTLSAFVTSSGSWVVPLHLARTPDLSAYVSFKERLNETITIRAQQGEATAVTDTLNDNPVPAMLIGKSYDFKKIQAETSPKPVAQSAPTVLGDATQATQVQTVAITQPANGAHLNTTLPLFQGTGISGNQVLVLVGISDPQTGSVTVDSTGVWRFTPAKELPSGKQSITITTKDKTGNTVALTNTFDIFKSGTQVLGDATPSATLTPTLAPTTIDTPTPTSTMSGEPVPITGGGVPTLIFMLLGTVLFMGGIAIFLL